MRLSLLRNLLTSPMTIGVNLSKANRATRIVKKYNNLTSRGKFQKVVVKSKPVEFVIKEVPLSLLCGFTVYPS